MDLTSHKLSSLSGREREVLRLLAKGHDIKSVARELSISSSAVTDRLRQARRKLGVSTSREAARILANLESGPTFGVHTSLGDAKPSDLMQQEPSKRFAGIGIAMTILIALAATLISGINVRHPSQTRNLTQFVHASDLAANMRAGSGPSDGFFAEDPRKLCQGHAPPHQREHGFILKCAARPQGQHASPLEVDDDKKLQPVGAIAPPARERNAHGRADTAHR